MEKPVLSILITSFNTRETTISCLQSIIESKIPLPYEILLWDNASTDNTQKSVRDLARRHTQIKLIENKENIGFGRGNNEAAKLSRGEYLLFLNSDILVLDDAIGKLFTFFKQHEESVHFLGGKLYNRDMTPQASAAPFFTLPVVFAFLFLKGDYWGLTRYSPDQFREVGWVSGACILTKKTYFDKLQGFDEAIFMYMEEVDLLYRAKKQGYNTYFYPDARFIHLGSASSRGRTFPILQVYKGYLYFYKKHYGRAALFILKIMLQLKAVTAVFIGRTTRNQYLIKTYGEAYQMVKEA